MLQITLKATQQWHRDKINSKNLLSLWCYRETANPTGRTLKTKPPNICSHRSNMTINNSIWKALSRSTFSSCTNSYEASTVSFQMQTDYSEGNRTGKRPDVSPQHTSAAVTWCLFQQECTAESSLLIIKFQPLHRIFFPLISTTMAQMPTVT